MKFELLPTIDTMFALYEKPRSFERFQEYIQTLQGGTKGDLVMPISGFNPMAKEHLLGKLSELKALNAELVIKETLSELNDKLTEPSPGVFKVALNLSDDLKGGWTNRYTSDYNSKFKINALVARKFCTPIFWTSENYDVAFIKARTLEYAYRTIYWLKHPKPRTLGEHVAQERFVAQKVGVTTKSTVDTATLDTFYQKNRDSDNCHIIFNFFYGDGASRSLEFPAYGIKDEMAGFGYVKVMDSNSNRA